MNLKKGMVIAAFTVAGAGFVYNEIKHANDIEVVRTSGALPVTVINVSTESDGWFGTKTVEKKNNVVFLNGEKIDILPELEIKSGNAELIIRGSNKSLFGRTIIGVKSL